MRITIIGAGAMGGAMAEGLLNSERFVPQDITVSDHNQPVLAHFAGKGTSVTPDNQLACSGADLVCVVVKPWCVEKTLKGIRDVLDYKSQKLIVVAAGVPSSDIKQWLDKDGATPSLFLVMPNIAIAYRQSMTFITPVDASDEDIKTVVGIYDELGESLAVNPSILSATGMDKGAVFTTTVISSAVATLVMALYAKMPFGLAPSMGLNAFFAYTVCLTMGYTWQFALTAVFIEGVIFILLTLTGLRNLIVDAMPQSLRRAIAPGIGLFIAFIGLKNSGIIVSNESTYLSLGNLHSPAVLLAIFGILLTSVLLIKNVMGALLIGIVVTTLIGIPLGVTHFTGLIDTPPSIAPIVWQMDWSHVFSFDMAVCVFTFLFVDMFDTIGTLVGVTTRAGMIDKDGKIHGLSKAFMADAIGTTVGAALGTSTVTTFVESAAGVNVGGRSGLTSFVVAVCFLLSLFFAPLFLSIPSEATASALFLVGVVMVTDMSKIDFTKYLEAIPCFITIIFMPLAYSISDGILLGVISYVILHLFSGNAKNLKVGTIVLALIFIARYAVL